MRELSLPAVEKLISQCERRVKLSRATTPRSALLPIHTKAASVLSDSLPGLESAAFDSLHREHQAEVARFAEEHKRHTIAGAAKASRRIETLVAAERAAFHALPADPFGPDSHLLLKVDFIRSWPSPEYLRDWRQTPGVNWAKYSFDTGDLSLGHAIEKVSFYNVWQNPRDVAVLVDVLVRLTALGHVRCSAGWAGTRSWFGGDNVGRVYASAQLTLWGLWTEPAPTFVVDNVPLGGCTVQGGFFGSSCSERIGTLGEAGDDEYNALTPALQKTGFPIPARASILIEASLVIEYTAEEGAVNVDFESDDLFSVGWAYATVTLPPEMMVNG